MPLGRLGKVAVKAANRLRAVGHKKIHPAQVARMEVRKHHRRCVDALVKGVILSHPEFPGLAAPHRKTAETERGYFEKHANSLPGQEEQAARAQRHPARRIARAKARIIATAAQAVKRIVKGKRR
jgi:hypothetical protein